MIRLMISISLSHTTRSCMMRWQSSLLKTTILLSMLATVLRLRNTALHDLPGRGCKCKHFNGEPCCRTFSVSHYQCRQLIHSELDLVVMEQLLALTYTDEMTQAKKHSPKERQRSFTYSSTVATTCVLRPSAFCTL